MRLAKPSRMGPVGAVAAIGKCQPYKLSLPIQAKKEYLVFDDPGAPGRRVTKKALSRMFSG